MAKNKHLNTKTLYKRLDKLFESSPVLNLDSGSKWVIFSDLHMGDGGSTDDFKRNAELFKNALSNHYLSKNFSLILNGDVEELQRFKIQKIAEQWHEVYEVFDEFNKKNAFFKTIGNHDLELQLMQNLPFNYEHHDAIRLKFQDQNLFVFHGHQASKKYQEHNEMIGFTLKYFANPLGIKSYSVSHSSKKQYKIERKVYEYSAFKKVVSVIGHTHRPLFESLDKVDRLKYKIEQLCREYSEDRMGNEEKRAEIKAHKKELKREHRKQKDHNFQSYVYNTLVHIPCVFNSGCVVGKRGMTCLEIEDEKIRLVHWFDKKISKKYLKQSGYAPEQLGDSDFYRLVINEESLHYIFTRIKFLA